MKITDLFKDYELLVAKADLSFQEMEKDYNTCINCAVQCSDCCNSMFGLFLIESAYINYHFNKLDQKKLQESVLRGDQADKDLLEIEKKLEAYKNDPQMQAYAIAKARIRCPLLNDSHKCELYPFRPITCRVYGIPTIINGQMHACWKAGFKKGESYPAFDLDGMFRELYDLSVKLLECTDQSDIEKASLLVSVSKSIKTPIEVLVNEM